MSEMLAEDAALDGGDVTEEPTDVTAGADADAAASGAAEAVVEAEAPTETPEGFGFADEYEAEAWARSRFDDYLHELAAQAPQPQADIPPVPDPFSDNYAEEYEARRQWEMRQLADEIRGEYAQREHEAYVNQAISSGLDATAEQFKIADEDKHLLAFLADQEADRLAAAGHRGEDSGRLAMSRAAEQLVARDKRIREEAVKAYREGVAGINDGRAEPGVEGAAIAAVSPANSYEDATRRVFEKHGIPYQ